MLHVSVESSVYLTDMWYLVIYEDDGNLRVLAEEEIRPIFPDEDEDEEVQTGDIVSALWIPNGKYYDAKVVQIGGEVYFRDTFLLTIKCWPPKKSLTQWYFTFHARMALTFFCTRTHIYLTEQLNDKSLKQGTKILF